MSELLKRLLRLFLLPIEGGEVTPDDAATAAAAAEAANAAVDDNEDLTIEDLTAAQDAAAAAPKPAAADVETPRERMVRERAERAEREVAEMRARSTPPPAQMGIDPQLKAEQDQIERERQAGASQDRLEFLHYQSRQNEQIRSANRLANSSMQAATDMRDQSAFNYFLSENPRFKRFGPEIEKLIGDNARAGGNFLGRQYVLAMLIGKAVMEQKPKAKGAAAEGKPAGSVARGRPAQARSDVSARQQKDERTARRARLENQLI